MSGFIFDDEVIFFVPGEVNILLTPDDGSDPYPATARLDSWKGSIEGKPVVTIPLEEA